MTENETYGWECPWCGAVGFTPVEYDYGVDPESGYHDAGVRCSKCARKEVA